MFCFCGSRRRRARRGCKVIRFSFEGTIKFKTIFLVVVVLISFGIMWSLIVKPLRRGWTLQHDLLKALDEASQVRVIEHSSPYDGGSYSSNYSETTFSTLALDDEQKKALRNALNLSLDYSGTIMMMCIFEEHHRIDIIKKDGSTTTLHICFHCGEIMIDDKGQRIMPLGWPSSLSQFISSLGLHPDGPWPLGSKPH